MKKLFFITAALLAAFMTTGCASTGRVHDKSYLRAAAVSGEMGGTLTLSFFSGDGALTVSGEDMEGARRAAELKMGTPVFTGYTELVIVDGSPCMDVLEHLLSDWKVSPSCMIVYSQNGAELLEECAPEQLLGMVKQAIKQDKAPECDIITILGVLCGDGRPAEIAELSSGGVEGKYIISPLRRKDSSAVSAGIGAATAAPKAPARLCTALLCSAGLGDTAAVISGFAGEASCRIAGGYSRPQFLPMK